MLIDSYSWVEFFKGTLKGKKVEKILAERICYTSLITLAEIYEFCLKFDQNVEKPIEKIRTLSLLLPLNQRICLLAGEINFNRKKLIKGWGMLDSLILATALINNLKILTGDEHFKDLSNVEML
jgi:predicted nucleic acid-binding protein